MVRREEVISNDGIQTGGTQCDVALENNEFLGFIQEWAGCIATIYRFLVNADDDSMRRHNCHGAGTQTERREYRQQEDAPCNALKEIDVPHSDSSTRRHALVN